MFNILSFSALGLPLSAVLSFILLTILLLGTLFFFPFKPSAVLQFLEPGSVAGSAVSGEAIAGGEGGSLQCHSKWRRCAASRHNHAARATTLGQTQCTLEPHEL